MRILLIGYGKMGQMIERLAPEYGAEVAGILDLDAPSALASAVNGQWGVVDAAIDFSVPGAVVQNVPALARLGINVVIGTTGWQHDEGVVRAAAAAAGIGVVAAPNFSTGVVLFEAVLARASELFARQPEFGAYLHEAHHAAKKDAPSGTALYLQRAMVGAGYARAVDVSSSRAGFIPGVHTIVFDGPAESITLTHAARDRSAFARGALTAASWLKGRSGWFSMHDVLGL